MITDLLYSSVQRHISRMDVSVIGVVVAAEVKAIIGERGEA